MSGREHGHAFVEALLVGILLLVPALWVLVVLSDLHRAALGATAAAREAGFEAVRASGGVAGERAASQAIRRAFADHALDADRAEVRVVGLDRFERGSEVTVEVAYPVRISRLPLIGLEAGPSIWVRARTSAVIDRYRSRE